MHPVGAGGHVIQFHDTDAVMQLFFHACFEAGPEACALHESSPSTIEARLTSLMDHLKSRPLSVASTDSTSSNELGYGLVDYRLVRELLFHFLYWPYGPRLTAQMLASALAAAEAGDGRPLWGLAASAQAKVNCDCDGERTVGSNPLQSIEAAIAIACGEADVVRDSFDELRERFKQSLSVSNFSEITYIPLFCS
jgi:hypothetical protein